MKHLAHSHRPSVSSKAIKAWFGPPEHPDLWPFEYQHARRRYYARPSRRIRHEDMVLPIANFHEVNLEDMTFAERCTAKDGRIWRDGKWQVE